MQFQITKNIADSISTKIIFMTFIKKVCKIKTTTILLLFVKLIIEHLSLNLSCR